MSDRPVEGEKPPPEKYRQTVPTDVAMNLTKAVDDGEQLPSLAPLDPVTEEARRRIREHDLPPPKVVEVEEEPLRFQFTIRQMMIANTVVVVLLAIARTHAPSLIAGVLGCLAFGSLLLVSVYQPVRREAYVAAWGMLALYVLLAILALAIG